jgi:hypothetical protein
MLGEAEERSRDTFNDNPTIMCSAEHFYKALPRSTHVEISYSSHVCHNELAWIRDLFTRV